MKPSSKPAGVAVARRPGRVILHSGPADVRPAAVALIAFSTLVAAIVVALRFSVEAATVRAAIETAVVLFGLVSAWLIWARSACTRSVSDLLLFAGVLTLTLSQFAFFAVPAMAGSRSPDWEAAVPLIAHLEVAGAFAAAALVGSLRVATRRQATVLLATPVAGATAVAVGALLIYGDAAWYGPGAHPVSTTTAQAVALTVPGVVLLLVAAVGFVRSVLRQRNLSIGLLGAATILLAAAWSQWLPVHHLTANSVSGGECLCLGAFGLILLSSLRSHTQLQRARSNEAIAVDRRRLVCDLHDGMAQDLAFIATYAEHLAEDFGHEHPLAVAARRALAATRGVMADVSASDAPNAAAALHAIAAELSIRHGVRVTVDARGNDLTGNKRETVVRVAREAIVNAIQHGHAKHIAVSLESRDQQLTLRISDDGRGLKKGVSSEPGRGFGLRAMRERTEAIGGRLLVDERPDGGTAVEAMVS